MALIDNIDGPNRRIYLGIDSLNATFDPMDIYKEMRTLRRTTEELRKYNLFLKASGRDPKTPGKFTEKFVTELEGTRIVPYDATQEITVTGTIISDDGEEGVGCFDRSSLSPATVVDINYVPKQVEVIEVTVGGGVGTPAEVADAVWQAVNGGISMEDMMLNLYKLMGFNVSRQDTVITIWEAEVGGTIWRQYDLAEGGRVLV